MDHGGLQRCEFVKKLKMNHGIWLEMFWWKLKHKLLAVAGILLRISLNHEIQLAIFNQYSKVKLFVIVETRLFSTIMMLKRFNSIKRNLMD